MKHVYLVFVSTFFLGFVTGGLVFLFNHTGKAGDGGIGAPAAGMSISAVAYGGCTHLGCPAYKIEDDGAYTYLTGSVSTPGRFTDSLTDRQLATLRAELADADFDAVAASRFTGTCPVAVDGVAYRFAIEYRGERHEVDTCDADVEGDPLFATLEDYFGIFDLLYAGQ